MPAAECSLSLPAPAKVNLFLRILAKRPDGYHELETRMQKLDLADRITLTVREGTGIRLACPRADLPADDGNLAWKAAEVFLAASRQGARCGVDIQLEKTIPIAAGLGGGSSDAGTVLKGLNRLFDNEFPEAALLDFGRRLGADVPFFVTDYAAVQATGIGDRMVPVPSLEHCTFVLVNPGFSVSTRWVYENFALTRETKNSTVPGSRKSSIHAFSLAEMENDLERVTIGRYPEIAAMKQRLLAAGAAAALMSGSGPTVFGIFPDPVDSASIDDLTERLRRDYGENVFTARARNGA